MPFDRFFFETAKRETRSIAFVESKTGQPDRTYLLHEMYCDEPDCDCRRVMLNVTSVEDDHVEAVIAFGWEDDNFYRRWYGHDDPETAKIIATMKGPVLNLSSPRTANSETLLRQIADKVLSDTNYVERLQRHYQLFRSKIDARSEPVRNTARKVGRNEPCPCNSGRKWKNCCGNSASMN